MYLEADKLYQGNEQLNMYFFFHNIYFIRIIIVFKSFQIIFIIQNITFRTVNDAIEYHIQASPVPYVNNTAQSRGTIPFPFSLAGQTVKDILQGATTTVGTSTADPGARTSTATSSPSSPPGAPSDAQTSALYNDGTGLAPSSAGSILDTIGGP